MLIVPAAEQGEPAAAAAAAEREGGGENCSGAVAVLCHFTQECSIANIERFWIFVFKMSYVLYFQLPPGMYNKKFSMDSDYREYYR